MSEPEIYHPRCNTWAGCPRDGGEILGNPPVDGGDLLVAGVGGVPCGWCNITQEPPVHGASTWGVPSGELVWGKVPLR